MKILGIETSCDETSAAVLEEKNGVITVLSNIVASSLSLHTQTGGIIPEIAAREQAKYIIPIIEEALRKAFDWNPSMTPPPIDAIAVTFGPGLIGSLLVGVETAKTLSYVWNKQLLGVNHMHGHLFANWISENNNKKEIPLPALGVVVSGNHTDLLLIQKDYSINVLGGTRDDAAGEAFDKIGRLLGLGYPAGPIISKLAEKGNPKAIHFPRPMTDTKTYEFSFSGLKTSVLNLSKKDTLKNYSLEDICASVQEAIVDTLVKKVMFALEENQVKSVVLGGGVSANSRLREKLSKALAMYMLPLFFPRPDLCTDNAAMIAAASIYTKIETNWKELTANPELYY